MINVYSNGFIKTLTNFKYADIFPDAVYLNQSTDNYPCLRTYRQNYTKEALTSYMKRTKDSWQAIDTSLKGSLKTNDICYIPITCNGRDARFIVRFLYWDGTTSDKIWCRNIGWKYESQGLHFPIGVYGREKNLTINWKTNHTSNFRIIRDVSNLAGAEEDTDIYYSPFVPSKIYFGDTLRVDSSLTGKEFYIKINNNEEVRDGQTFTVGSEDLTIDIYEE